MPAEGEADLSSTSYPTDHFTTLRANQRFLKRGSRDFKALKLQNARSGTDLSTSTIALKSISSGAEEIEGCRETGEETHFYSRYSTPKGYIFVSPNLRATAPYFKPLSYISFR